MKPRLVKPGSSIAQVEGSGTAATVMVNELDSGGTSLWPRQTRSNYVAVGVVNLVGSKLLAYSVICQLT